MAACPRPKRHRVRMVGSGADSPLPGRRARPVAPTASFRSATPRPPMTGDHVRRRHVWVDGAGGYQRPELVIAWRKSKTEWEAYVARVHGNGEVLITWESASHLQPVIDDGWAFNPKDPRRSVHGRRRCAGWPAGLRMPVSTRRLHATPAAAAATGRFARGNRSCGSGPTRPGHAHPGCDLGLTAYLLLHRRVRAVRGRRLPDARSAQSCCLVHWCPGSYVDRVSKSLAATTLRARLAGARGRCGAARPGRR